MSLPAPKRRPRALTALALCVLGLACSERPAREQDTPSPPAADREAVPPADSAARGAEASTSVAVTPALDTATTAIRLSSKREATGRLRVAIAFDSVWSRGLTIDDSSLLMPSSLAATGSHLFTFDGGMNRVVAFDLATGTLLWTVGRSGAGPGEFTRNSVVSPAHSRGVWVLDRGNQRLTLIDTLGLIVRQTPLKPFGSPAYVCQQPGGETWIYSHLKNPPFTRISDDGEVLQELDWPWSFLKGASPLITQSVFRTTTDGCVVTLTLGEGFAVLSGNQWKYSARYVEHWPLPLKTTESVLSNGAKVEHVPRGSRYAARGATQTRNCVLVPFVVRGQKGSNIDVYATVSGAYERSLYLPRIVNDVIAVSDTLLVATSTADDYPGIVLYRVEVPSCTTTTR